MSNKRPNSSWGDGLIEPEYPHKRVLSWSALHVQPYDPCSDFTSTYEPQRTSSIKDHEYTTVPAYSHYPRLEADTSHAFDDLGHGVVLESGDISIHPAEPLQSRALLENGWSYVPCVQPVGLEGLHETQELIIPSNFEESTNILPGIFAQPVPFLDAELPSLPYSQWPGVEEPFSFLFPDQESQSSVFLTSCDGTAAAADQQSDSSPTDIDTIEICYGMIVGAQVALFKALKGPETVQTWEEGRTLFVRLRFRADGVTVLGSGMIELGQLETSYSQILKNLLKTVPSLRCEAYITPDDTGDVGLSKIYPIDINIYGNQCDLHLVGSFLSNVNVFLQEPEDLQKSYPYQNPHVFSRSDELATPLFRGQHSLAPIAFRDEIDAIIHTSTAVESSCSPIQDPRLQTQLKSHQVSALHFMSKREEEIVHAESLTLWQPYKNERKTRFKHIVTGELVNERSPECRGGLLADSMGMGKSFTVLALIVISQNQAQRYIKERTFSGLEPSRATLIVTPKSTIKEWLSEINRHTSPNLLKVYVYHGDLKTQDHLRLKYCDIVLTTYETLGASLRSDCSILLQLAWFRVVLDEAHWIRNFSTDKFRAVDALEAQRRWCLTGTPIQNGLNDIFSLTKFLRFYPFHTDASVRKYITRPLQIKDQKGLDNLRSMMKIFSLRRLKDSCINIERRERTIPVTLSSVERQRYQNVVEQTTAELLKMSLSDKISSSIKLQGILKLRQICSHGEVGLEARLALDTTPRQGHPVWGACAKNPYAGFDRSRQPQCELTLSYEELPPESMDSFSYNLETQIDSHLPDPMDWELMPQHISSKINSVVSEIRKLDTAFTENLSFPIKSLVFSSWKTTLDHLEKILSNQGMSYARIDGSYSIEQRAIAIRKFKSEPYTKIMLLTLGSGSVGLNLTEASHVHIVEPFWNPMVEEQAAGRVHRIGQTRPVTINRYIVENSIEERIQKMQKRKLWLADLSTSEEPKSLVEELFDDPQPLL